MKYELKRKCYSFFKLIRVSLKFTNHFFQIVRNEHTIQKQKTKIKTPKGTLNINEKF